MKEWLRLFDARLLRPVQTLRLGGLFNAFGNGVVLPFTLIYLHNVRGISLTAAGLVLATNAVVALVSGPDSGPLVDRLGGRRVLALALLLLAAGFGSYAFVHAPGRRLPPPPSPASATGSSGRPSRR